jgi:hypothetical protein
MMYPPFTQWVAVAPSDSVDLANYTTKGLLTHGVYVGGTGGDVACVDQSGTAVTFTGVPAGTILRVAARRINLSGTSASGIVACYWI